MEQRGGFGVVHPSHHSTPRKRNDRWLQYVAPPALAAAIVWTSVPEILHAQSGFRWFGRTPPPAAPQPPRPENGFGVAVQKLLEESRRAAASGDFETAIQTAKRAHKIADAAAGVLGEDPNCSPAATQKFVNDLVALSESTGDLLLARTPPAQPPHAAQSPAGRTAGPSSVTNAVATSTAPARTAQQPQQHQPQQQPLQRTPVAGEVAAAHVPAPHTPAAQTSVAQTPAATSAAPTQVSERAPRRTPTTAPQPLAAAVSPTQAAVPSQPESVSEERREWLAFLKTTPSSGQTAPPQYELPVPRTMAVAPGDRPAPVSIGARSPAERPRAVAAAQRATDSTPQGQPVGATPVVAAAPLAQSDVRPVATVLNASPIDAADDSDAALRNQPYLGLTEFTILGGDMPYELAESSGTADEFDRAAVASVVPVTPPAPSVQQPRQPNAWVPTEASSTQANWSSQTFEPAIPADDFTYPATAAATTTSTLPQWTARQPTAPTPEFMPPSAPPVTVESGSKSGTTSPSTSGYFSSLFTIESKSPVLDETAPASRPPQVLAIDGASVIPPRAAETAIFAVDNALLISDPEATSKPEPQPASQTDGQPGTQTSPRPQSTRSQSSGDIIKSAATDETPAPTEWSSTSPTPRRASATNQRSEQSPWQPTRAPKLPLMDEFQPPDETYRDDAAFDEKNATTSAVYERGGGMSIAVLSSPVSTEVVTTSLQRPADFPSTTDVTLTVGESQAASGAPLRIDTESDGYVPGQPAVWLRSVSSEVTAQEAPRPASRSHAADKKSWFSASQQLLAACGLLLIACGCWLFRRSRSVV